MTNKTDKNSNETRSGAEAQSQIEQLPTNTNPRAKYEAILCFTQHSRARVVIEADSLDEAREKAAEIYPDELDVEDWNPFAGDLYVDSVKPLEGGQDHD